jgi:transposase
MVKKYIVELSAEEREQIQEIISKGKHSARKILRAHALLKSDEGWSDSHISEALNISIPTLERTRKLFVEEGLNPALNGRESNRVYTRKLDGEKEAQLIALVCSKAPEGQARWTMRLLADRMVQLEYIEEISHETIRRTLKKTNLNLG